ncbi:MAG TPA: ABC transporter ATP-binding protein [Acidimicrobiales bacterium]|nr:ABC transporter ATP-binding protein [Acidimicrobiales bacterium]
MVEGQRRRKVTTAAKAPAEPPAVLIEGLRKSFGRKPAVVDLSLVVPAGAFFGLVGPNGAGKSTTLRMTTGLLRPDAGRASICGQDVWSDPVGVKALLGLLTEDLRLFDRLSGSELLTYNGLLRQMPPEVIRARSEELLEVLDLAGARHTLVVDYSQGMRKKIALACALLHAPRVLFLDEPFESVDPVSTRTIRTVLQRYTLGGGTVVFSSHVMETVERLCDHVAIMSAGRVVAAGPADEVRGGRRLEEIFFERVGARPDAPQGLEWLATSSD